MKDQCQSCRFWERMDEESGLCRRHAPSPGKLPGSLWPETYGEDWCGEFQPLPVQQKMEAPSAVAGKAP